MSRFSYYDIQTIDLVFSLQGKVTRAEAEDQTGVPQATIKDWWRGRRDPYRTRDATNGERCRHGHRRTPENTYRRPGGRRTCAVCDRMAGRKARLRSAGALNRRYWYPSSAILDALSDVDLAGLSTHYPTRARYIIRLRSGEQKWVSVEKADELLCHFGLTIHMLPVEPTAGSPNSKGGM